MTITSNLTKEEIIKHNQKIKIEEIKNKEEKKKKKCCQVILYNDNFILKFIYKQMNRIYFLFYRANFLLLY